MCPPFFTLALLLVGTDPTVRADGKGKNTTPVVVGVHPSLEQITYKALNEESPLSTFEILLLSDDKTTTEYESINRTITELEDSSIHLIISPYERKTAIATESINVSYLSTSPVLTKGGKSTFQMVPESEVYWQAMLELLKSYHWDKTGLFYDSSIAVPFLEKLLAEHLLTVKVWRISPFSTEREIRDSLINLRKVFIHNVIMLTGVRNVNLTLQQGSEVSSVLTAYKEIDTNFTVLHLVPYNFTESHDVSVDQQYSYALVRDSVRLLKEAVWEIEENFSTEKMRTEITTRIKQVQTTGLTGYLKLNNDGNRVNVSLAFTAVFGDVTQKIADWNSGGGPNTSTHIQLHRRLIRQNRTKIFPLKHRTVKVVTIKEKPFVMYKRDYKHRKGNDRFQGFAVDLIEEVAAMLDFKYRLYLVHDGKFGAKKENGEWNGMIGELLTGNATMTVASLSINSEREEAVDFTKPFMTRYINVLMKVPKSETSHFEFLNPLSPLVWICTFGAFIVVSVVLYFLEKAGRAKNRSESISFRESFWFIFGSLLQGNTDASPCTVPGRVLTSAWWFFALILISSYTANLAAFLTVKKINTPIKTVTDLPQQTKIRYGTVKNSGIMAFFRNTNIEQFNKMWIQMSELDPTSMVDNSEEGFRKVREGNYAFFWDTTVNGFKTIEDCSLMEVGPQFDPKGFGIAVPPGATYRDDLSMAILKLSDRGKLHELESKWWHQKKCPDVSKPTSEETSELQLENVAGVFFILVGGILIAGLVCWFEYCSTRVLQLTGGKKTRRMDNSYL